MKLKILWIGFDRKIPVKGIIAFDEVADLQESSIMLNLTGRDHGNSLGANLRGNGFLSVELVCKQLKNGVSWLCKGFSVVCMRK